MSSWWGVSDRLEPTLFRRQNCDSNARTRYGKGIVQTTHEPTARTRQARRRSLLDFYLRPAGAPLNSCQA